MNKKYMILIATIVVLIIAVYAGLSYGVRMFYSLALDPKTPKGKVFSSENIAPTRAFSEDNFTKAEEWLKSDSIIVDTKAFDNVALKAYAVKRQTPTDKWAVVIHGYTQDPLQMAPNAKEFYERGYNVLVPNLRGHGLSGGDYIGMGFVDKKDIVHWINKIIEINPASEIVLYGVSMGGATVMMTAGEELQANVKCAIEDCGYTSAWDEFSYQLKELYGLPKFPMMYLVNRYVNMKAGYDLKEASALEAVKRCRVPMLFIHGDADKFVPFSMFEELYNAAACEKDSLVVSGAGHAESFKVAPDVYWSKVFQFIDKHVE